MTSLRRVILVLPLLGLAFSGCSSSHGTASSAPDTIVIKNFAFDPGALRVAPGATVTVRNEDRSTHTVTADGHAFDTGNVPGGAATTFKAPTKAGRYPYICEMHQYMTGTLVVS